MKFLMCVGCASEADIKLCNTMQTQLCEDIGGTGKWQYQHYNFVCQMPDGSAKESFPLTKFCRNVNMDNRGE